MMQLLGGQCSGVYLWLKIGSGGVFCLTEFQEPKPLCFVFAELKPSITITSVSTKRTPYKDT